MLIAPKFSIMGAASWCQHLARNAATQRIGPSQLMGDVTLIGADAHSRNPEFHRNNVMSTTKLPSHLFVSSTDGHLYDTRKPDWAEREPVRRCYQYASRSIENTVALKGALRQGYAWPGGYALYGVTQDGAALCMDCMRKEYRQIVWDFLHNASTGWRVVAIDATCNCDESPVCAHCGKEIE